MLLYCTPRAQNASRAAGGEVCRALLILASALVSRICGNWIAVVKPQNEICPAGKIADRFRHVRQFDSRILDEVTSYKILSYLPKWRS